MSTFDPVPSDLAVFSFYRIHGPIGGGARRLVVSSCSLPASALRCLWLDENLTQPTLFTRLEASFVSFGGVPREVALRPTRPFGQPARDDQSPWLRPFLRFCRHFGCEPLAIPSNDPRDTDLPELAEDLLRSHAWHTCEEAQRELQRRHGADGQQVAGLLPLPRRLFVRSKETFRKVSSDGFVSFAGDSYSLPPFYAGQSVWVRRNNNRIDICLQDGTHVASHLPGDGRGIVRLEEWHFETARKRTQHDLYRLRLRFLARFPHYDHFLEQLTAQRRLGAASTLRALLVLARTAESEALEEAIQACLRYNNFSHRFLQGFLDRQAAASPTIRDDDPVWTEGFLF